MKRNFIIDEEINLLGKNDLLNTNVYAQNLKKAIVNAPSNKPFTIGLFGEWGSGKSSIVKTVREEIEGTKNTKIKFIIYDAWKYSNDSFRRMFLLCLKNELGFEGSQLMNSFYLNESEDVSIKKEFKMQNILILFGILLIGLLIIHFSGIQKDGDNWKFSLTAFISYIGLLIAIFFKAFDELKVNIQKPHLFAPEQFEDCFKEMVQKSLKDYNWIEKKCAMLKVKTS
jgi:hypothetical protein